MLYTSIFLGYSNFVFYKYGTHLASYQSYPGAHMGNVLLKKKKLNTEGKICHIFQQEYRKQKINVLP